MKLFAADFLSQIAGRIYRGRLEAILHYGQVAVVLYFSPAGQARYTHRDRSCCGVLMRSLETPLFVRDNSDNQTSSISTLPRIGQVVLQLQIVYLPKAAAWGGDQDQNCLFKFIRDILPKNTEALMWSDNPSMCWVSKVR